MNRHVNAVFFVAVVLNKMYFWGENTFQENLIKKKTKYWRIFSSTRTDLLQ